ncbi:MAG: hypothetical protein ING44_10260 [Telmatospirillum sp.]|nr:hypothetical protein [Telmatospirillum sp.]
MDRRLFLTVLATGIGIAPLAQAQMREDMRKRWDEMDHSTRERAMDRMRGPRTEPSYEQMRERWDKMSPETRRKMMERHDQMHGQIHR